MLSRVGDILKILINSKPIQPVRSCPSSCRSNSTIFEAGILSALRHSTLCNGMAFDLPLPGSFLFFLRGLEVAHGSPAALCVAPTFAGQSLPFNASSCSTAAEAELMALRVSSEVDGSQA